MAAQKPRLLMCRPDEFNVHYAINPWMEGNEGRIDREKARRQWEELRSVLEPLAELHVVNPPPKMPDIVFTANAGLVVDKKAVLCNFLSEERREEVPHHAKWLSNLGYETINPPDGIHFEGTGDALYDRDTGRLWIGYGIRTNLEIAEFLQTRLGVEVTPLRLVDERFYHLDTCFRPLTGGYLIYYPPAFDDRSRRIIEELVSYDKRLAVNERDAMRFACNGINIGNKIILNDCSEETEAQLGAWGFELVRVPLDQFVRSGGSAHCLVLTLDEPEPAHVRRDEAAFAHRTISYQGHVIDTGLLARVMDRIAELGGSFEMLKFRIGQRRDDESFVRMDVRAPGEDLLERILRQLVEMGGALDDLGERPARLTEVEMDGVAPDDFYGTTIYPTDVLINGQWVRAQRQRMDGVLVVEEGNNGKCDVIVTLIRDVKAGQKVVTGIDGIRVLHRPREREEDEFKFMSSNVSSERRVETAVDHVAWEMEQIRKRGGKIAIVAGPVTIHTGGVPHVCELVRNGYIQVLLSGNALAVHDIERSFFGTSLGVDLDRGVVVHGGHRHHLLAINRIRRCGSIAAAVEQGVLTNGIMYECVRAGVRFSLAGSIRDDGPLPDTRMDLIEAQSEHAELLRGADMVLMLSTMLHSIGVGNMTPAGVKMVCVDINTSVATKLADRGSMEAIPVVTDVGLFLNLLVRKLKELRT